MQQKVKSDTRLDKIHGNVGRSKSTELAAGGTAQDVSDASQVGHRSASQRRWDCRHLHSEGLSRTAVIVPVLALDGEPLMPTCFSRARRWVKEQRATPFWLNGVWCIRLRFEPSARNKQKIVVGIDPGSKREAYTVASAAHTYLNVLSDAVNWVKDAVESRKILRRNRRNRKTPCRANRKNRARGGIPPSTKARWQLKLRIVNQLRKMFPITGYAVEDIKATTHGKGKCWNSSFSPLEVGKRWLYAELSNLGELTLKAGHETAELRKTFGVVKTHGDKMSIRFDVHNVDSWVLAKDALGTKGRPENIRLVHARPLQFRRRALHLQNPSRGGIRRSHGGTLSQGFKRGSLARHPKHGLTTVGGTKDGRVSLHNLNGKRLCQNAKAENITLLRRSSIAFRQILKNGIPLSPEGDSLLPKIL
jgi:RRXRR protein